MKKLTILLIFVVSVSLATAAKPLSVSVWLAPATPQQNEYIYDYGYQDASVVVNHRAVMDNFKGTLQATGLKPGFTYQVKLEGPGSLASTTEERLANEMIGLSGRWWYDGFNRNDAFYYDNKDTFNIIGYLVFDFFTADENGNANVHIVSDESYHVLWCGPTAHSNTFLYIVDVTQSPFSDYSLKCVDPMLCDADDVIPEIERPEFSALPEGDYPNVRLVLAEESFHQSCGTWSTVMGAETSFSIDAEPVPDINANGSGGPVDFTIGETLSVTIEFDPGDYPGVQADWWCLAETPFGWYYYNDSTETWLPGFQVSYQGPLGEVSPPLEVLNVSDLPLGSYTFYFGVDGNRNGNLGEPLYYDSVDVTITSP